MSEAKKPRTAKQRYAFKYWRRGFRALGFSLDRWASRNSIMYSLSGHGIQTQLIEPGIVLRLIQEKRLRPPA